MEKFITGIDGFDDVTKGGLPRARISLIAGGPGCGKTLFMLTALAHAAQNGEPAVFFTFEERPEDIVENAAPMGLDLKAPIDSGTLRIEHIKRPTESVEEAGSYTLDGLLMRIELALKSTDAQVIAIDTIETLFGMFENERTVRSELVRLFNWLKDRGVTGMISGEQGDGQVTRHGLEEYVSDCVVLLDQRVIEDVATRRLRIIKYRGSEHSNNEYPFLIDSQGITVMPLSSAALNHQPSDKQVTTGMTELDEALCGGHRRGSSVLISGKSGTGKSIFAISFLAEACRRGERGILLSFEESPNEIMLNAKSLGIDLEAEVEAERLVIFSTRPAILGLEQHLVQVHRLTREVKPRVMVVDALSSLISAGEIEEVHRTIIRLIDHLKRQQITSVFTSEAAEEGSGIGVSSIIDAWLSLGWAPEPDDFTRRLKVIKKRGSDHVKDYLHFEIGSNGVQFESGSDG